MTVVDGMTVPGEQRGPGRYILEGKRNAGADVGEEDAGIFVAAKDEGSARTSLADGNSYRHCADRGRRKCCCTDRSDDTTRAGNSRRAVRGAKEDEVRSVGSGDL